MNSSGDRVVIVDPSAGMTHGHHAHWNRRLTLNLQSHGLTCKTIGPDFAERFTSACWYQNAIKEACFEDATDLIFTSGDDAIVPSLLQIRTLRSSSRNFHYLIFRLEPQPRPGGWAILALKILALLLLRLVVGKVEIYTLEMPFRMRSKWRSWLGFRPVIDSSAVETSPPVGKTQARVALEGLRDTGVRFVLVIGVLSSGKHVDTVLDAWRASSFPNTMLVFAGAADSETTALIEGASDRSDILYLPGRLSDDKFDRLIEAADVVVTLYRYSASSGIALKALRLGTRVLAGGSKVLLRQLRLFPQVTLLRRVTADTVASGLAHCLSQPDAVPIEPSKERDSLFPAPIVDRIARAKD